MSGHLLCIEYRLRCQVEWLGLINHTCLFPSTVDRFTVIKFTLHNLRCARVENSTPKSLATPPMIPRGLVPNSQSSMLRHCDVSPECTVNLWILIDITFSIELFEHYEHPCICGVRLWTLENSKHERVKQRIPLWCERKWTLVRIGWLHWMHQKIKQLIHYKWPKGEVTFATLTIMQRLQPN